MSRQQYAAILIGALIAIPLAIALIVLVNVMIPDVPAHRRPANKVWPVEAQMLADLR